MERDVCSTWDSFKPLLFTLACSQRQSSRELNGWIYAAPKSINVPFLCVHLASWPLCSPHFEWMLLGGPKSPLLIERDGVLLNPCMKIPALKCWWNNLEVHVLLACPCMLMLSEACLRGTFFPQNMNPVHSMPCLVI